MTGKAVVYWAVRQGGGGTKPEWKTENKRRRWENGENIEQSGWEKQEVEKRGKGGGIESREEGSRETKKPAWRTKTGRREEVEKKTPAGEEMAAINVPIKYSCLSLSLAALYSQHTDCIYIYATHTGSLPTARSLRINDLSVGYDSLAWPHPLGNVRNWLISAKSVQQKK